MDMTSLIGIILFVVIIVTGISIKCWTKHKLKEIDGVSDVYVTKGKE